MSAAEKHEILTEAAYLALEETAAERHELVGGVMYAMAGETTRQNQIAGRLYSDILNHLPPEGRCRPFFNGVKLRLPVATTFYYPDLMVTCDPRDADERFIQHPRLIIEVLSESTQVTDRRAEGWEPRPLPPDATELHLATLDLRVPLARLCEGVTF